MNNLEIHDQLNITLKMSAADKKTRLLELTNIPQGNINEKEKVELLILKFEIEGKKEFLGDSYITIVLRDLILTRIDAGKEVNEFLSDLYIMHLMDWLIDWEKSSESKIEVRQDIVQNIHSFISPFLEEIEEVLGESFKSRDRRNISVRIVGIVDGLFGYQEKSKIPEIIHSIWKMKYVLEGAREYMKSDKRKIIIIDSVEYKLDLESIAHVFVRHSKRFETLSHRDNQGKRGYFDIDIGDEFEKLNDLLEIVHHSNSKVGQQGVVVFQDGNDRYKMVVRDGRIVTLYPID